MTPLERVLSLDRIAELNGHVAEMQFLVNCPEYWILATEGLSQARAEAVKTEYLGLLADFERLLAESEELHRSPPPSLRKQISAMLLEGLEKQDKAHTAREGEGHTDAK